jgi:hypothetical protein
LCRSLGASWNEVLASMQLAPAANNGVTHPCADGWHTFDRLVDAERALARAETDTGLEIVNQRTVRYRNRGGQWITAVANQLR